VVLLVILPIARRVCISTASDASVSSLPLAHHASMIGHKLQIRNHLCLSGKALQRTARTMGDVSSEERIPPNLAMKKTKWKKTCLLNPPSRHQPRRSKRRIKRKVPLTWMLTTMKRKKLILRLQQTADAEVAGVKRIFTIMRVL